MITERGLAHVRATLAPLDGPGRHLDAVLGDLAAIHRRLGEIDKERERLEEEQEELGEKLSDLNSDLGLAIAAAMADDHEATAREA